MLLPYIEQGTLYDQVDFHQETWYQNPPRVWNARIESFLCPSVAPTAPQATNDYLAGGPGCNYAVSVGPTLYWSSGQNFPGAFSTHHETRIAQFLDGTSNTILAAEMLSGDGSYNGQFWPGEPVANAQYGGAHPWNKPNLPMSAIAAWDQSCLSHIQSDPTDHLGSNGWAWLGMVGQLLHPDRVQHGGATQLEVSHVCRDRSSGVLFGQRRSVSFTEQPPRRFGSRGGRRVGAVRH